MPQPFRVDVPQAAIDDLHARLDATRWPDELDGVGWGYGVPRDTLRDLVGYWRDRFDWRAAEARINAFDQYKVAIDGLDTHVIHQRSPHANATPLLITHGWPGSIAEFLEVIPRLTDPERFGGRAEDAFHVVAPSLPGYGWSAPATQPGMSPKRIAERHLALMALLGYDRFVAQGGDWGSMISRFLPDLAPDRVIGLHLNMIQTRPPAGIDDPIGVATPAERERLQHDQAAWHGRSGYFHVQQTRPQTLAYGLNDSPAGLAAWIADKFHDWTDHDGDMRDALSYDAMLTNIAIYWFTGTIGSSARLYYEFGAALARQEFPSARVDRPFGAAHYPKELTRPPRAWIEREFNLVHWFEAEKGGHFAAFEQPATFAADLWAFHARLKEIGA